MKEFRIGKNSFRISLTDIVGVICLIIGAGVLIWTACFVLSDDIWFDELFTVELAAMPLDRMLPLAAADVHPPLYYILVRIVYITISKTFGISLPASAKLTSLIPYILVFVYLITCIRKRFGLLCSGVSLLMIETMPHMSEFMIEARMYSWSAFVIMAMFIHAMALICYTSPPGRTDDTVGMERVKNKNKNKNKGIDGSMLHLMMMLIYGIAAMYLHYYALICAGIIALIVIAASLYTGRNITPVILCAVIAAICYIPWIRVLIEQIGQVSEGYWIQPVTIRTIPGCLKYIYKPEFEHPYTGYACAGIMIACHLLLIIKTAFNNRKHKNKADIPFCRILSPACFYGFGSVIVLAGLILAGMLASVILRPVFVYRYMFPAMFVFWLGFGVMLGGLIDSTSISGKENGEAVRVPQIEQTGLRYHKHIVVYACIIAFALIYIMSMLRSFNLFRWEEERKREGMKMMEAVFDDISESYSDSLIVCNFNQIQALMWYYLDNDSVLWGETDETLIARICGRFPIIMVDDTDALKSILDEREQSGFLFFGSGNAREEIIAGWESDKMITKLLQDSCFLERYWVNIYEIGFEEQ